jgi:choline dehydrogenase
LSYFRSTVRNGFRHSSADAFLRPALKRPNLRLVSHALVERLNISNGQAWGVHYRTGDQLTSVRAAREVIVSAGAINSPQLLQLSGIGPADLLKSHGIAVEHDLEQVGKGLQDHLAISHYFDAREPTLNNKLGNRFGQLLAGIQYVITRRGALSVPVNQVGGFVRSSDTCSVPDMQVFCNPASYTIAATGKLKIDRAPGYLLSAQPCRPTSRGEVLIASSDPKEAPLIHPNSLSTEADIRAALRACKLVRALALTPTLQNVTKIRKSPDVTAMSEQEMLENFRQRASTVFHPTCTCRMGSDATDSVLDARLKVHGVRRLRVVDASAFPNITSGNTNAPTIMLAMRAADLILEDAVARTD